jgi:glycosyltransferase involved in cell wall biosynthesis
MRLLFVADGRSPIAIQWMRHFIARGDEVSLASTFPCQPELALKSLDILDVAFSGVKTRVPASPAKKSGLWGASALGLRTAIRQWLGPLTIRRAALQLRAVIQRTQPDLVHAMRIPYEGMTAADAYTGVPLLVSIWGNDFTLHAPSTPLMRHYTHWALSVADALHADCQRDITLARKWGYKAAPTLVTPGNGGIQADIFFPPPHPPRNPLIINPRGFRAYVHNESFFRAIPLVLKERPDARFLCASMDGEPRARAWIEQLGISQAVTLLAPMPHARMADVFRQCQIVVSPAFHDGTPNTLLEGMACGCLPIAGDLDSIREWITDGQNGLLIDPASPVAIARAILRGLEDATLRQNAAAQNAQIIASRAEYHQNMLKVEEFYRQVIS